MKKFNLHQWLPLLTALVIFAGCSKKSYPAKNDSDASDKYENTAPANDNVYSPPPVVSITDDQAKSNKDGEMYYDNELGYRYWKFCDGKYYLDTKYESGGAPNKKIAKKQSKKERKKSKKEDYASE